MQTNAAPDANVPEIKNLTSLETNVCTVFKLVVLLSIMRKYLGRELLLPKQSIPLKAKGTTLQAAAAALAIAVPCF